MKIDVDIVLSNEDRRMLQKFIVYENDGMVIELNKNSEALKKIVQEAISNFKGEPDNIIVKTRMLW